MTKSEIMEQLPEREHLIVAFPFNSEAPDSEQDENHVGVYLDGGFCVYPVVNDEYGKTTRVYLAEEAADLVIALLA